MQTQLNAQQNKAKFSLGFFFLSLGVLISLITSVVSFLNLVFGTLEKQFPDALNATYQYGYNSYNYDSIRMALATLIIFFPIFLIVSYFWKKHSRRMGSIDTIIRKWVMYIILFLSAIVVAVDLVTLVRYFVSGEITTRFILKVVAVLIVALIVGIYYILELQGKEKIFVFNVGAWSAIKSSILVIALIIWSFHVMGTPGQQRVWRLDDRRVQDLQSIQWQVISYWQQKEKLPASLSDLSNPLSGFAIPVDPEFEKGNTYEYSVKAAGDAKTDPSFELCATYSAVMPQGWQENQGYGGITPFMDTSVSARPVAAPGGSGVNESWDHQAGRTCYTRTIDKDLYPPYPKPATEPAAKMMVQ
ncbi:MAG: DUF5671 domain-containing protein [bacterium]